MVDNEDGQSLDVRTGDTCFGTILFCLFCAPLVPICVIIFLVSAYYKRQKHSLKRFREFLTYDIRHPVRNGPAVVEDILNLPPTVTWTVTCNRHKAQTDYCKKKYKVTRQWPNTEELWSVNTSIQGPRNIYDRAYVRLTVVVELLYTIPSEFANQLEQKERELYLQHLECDHSKLSIERQRGTTHHKFIVPDGYSTWWIPMAYWINSLFLCCCSLNFLNNEVVYTIEKIYIGGRTRQAVAAVGTSRATSGAAAAVLCNRPTQEEPTTTNEDDLPPSYQDFLEDPNKYKHSVPDQQVRLQNQIIDNYGNSSNHGNIGTSAPPPSYNEYMSKYSKLSGHHIIIRLEEPSPAPSSVTYEQEIPPGRIGGSPANRSVAADNLRHLDLGHSTLSNSNTDTLQSDSQSETSARAAYATRSGTSVFTTSQSSNFGLRQYQTTQEITPNPNDGGTCVTHL